MKDEKKESNKLILIGIISIITIIAIVVATRSMNLRNNHSLTEVEDVDIEDLEYISIDELERQESIQALLRSQYQPLRGYRDGVYKGQKFKLNDIFEFLPAIPDDFYKIKYLMMSGRVEVDTLCTLTPQYFEQPEFYRNSFAMGGILRYQNPDPYHWTPEGYGTYPHEMEVITVPGETLKSCTFFHTSWGVETYQGFGLRPVYLSKVGVGEDIIDLDVEDTKKYFTMKISPDSILLTPTYVKFRSGWAKKIILTVDINDNTPPGVYGVGFDVARARIEDARVWKDQYQEMYFPKSSFGVNEIQFKMVITVEPKPE